MDIISVLSKYYKGQEWSLNGDAYERLIWYDERNTLPKPIKIWIRFSIALLVAGF